MLARHLSRQVLARSVVTPRAAPLAVHGGGLVPSLLDSSCSAVPRRYIISDADLSPMDQLSEARQKLRQALMEYRDNK